MLTVSERPHPSEAAHVSPPIRRTIGRSAAAWSLDAEAFTGLLRFLDRDRDLAAARYEDVRSRLVKLFAWRGCTAPEEYADRTIDRVARRLADGLDISVADPYQYFHGVALNLLREHARERARQRQVFDSVASAVAQSRDEAEQEREELDRTLACLEACLNCLPPRTRSLLLAYHARPGQIARRQQLAASLGIPIGALRTRVHRIRAAVERCVTNRIFRLELNERQKDHH